MKIKELNREEITDIENDLINEEHQLNEISDNIMAELEVHEPNVLNILLNKRTNVRNKVN